MPFFDDVNEREDGDCVPGRALATLSTLKMLLEIARHPVIADGEHASLLPSPWEDA